MNEEELKKRLKGKRLDEILDLLILGLEYENLKEEHKDTRD